MSFAPVNCTEMNYELREQGNLVLLLHAGVDDSRMWDGQFEEFLKSQFVTRCDLRSFGKSENVSGSFAHYENIATLLKYLNFESVSLIGASFGGYVALDFALAYPEMVVALIRVAPVLGGYELT